MGSQGSSPSPSADRPCSIAQRRAEYTRGGLSEAQAGHDPIVLFDRWFAEAAETNQGPEYEPNVATLATADTDGSPSARIVLLKGYDARGFVFFTSYQSRKARDLEANPRAALVFHWIDLERQVRIAGTVEKVSRAESEAYFATRPRGSQLGAWVGPQSQPVTREDLDRRLNELEAEYAGRDVPCPPHWGGYRLRPQRIEFWQGRPNRLHDRILFSGDPDVGWERQRLSP